MERLIEDVLIRIDVPLTRPERRTLAILLDPCLNTVTLSARYQCARQTITNVKELKTMRAKRIHRLLDQAGIATFLKSPDRRFTQDELKLIRESTTSSVALSRELGCASSTIRMVRTGKTYASR